MSTMSWCPTSSRRARSRTRSVRDKPSGPGSRLSLPVTLGTLLLAFSPFIPRAFGGEFDVRPGCLEYEGSWSRGAYIDTAWTNHAVAHGSSLFLTFGGSVVTFDLNQAGVPYISAELSRPGWEIYAVAITGDRLVIVDAYLPDHGWETSLRVIDLTDPHHLVELGTHPLSEPSLKIAASGSHVFLARYGGGLSVFDISDHSNPVEQGFLATLEVRLMDAADDFVYLTDNQDLLHVIDVSDPSQPRVVGRLTTEQITRKIVEYDGFLYTLGGGLRVIDVSDPSNPTLVSHLDVTGSDLDIMGHTAFVGKAPEGLLTFDVSDPSNPRQLGSLGTTSVIRTLAVGDDLAWGHGDGRVTAIDVSDPSEPREIGWVKTSFRASRIVVANRLAFFAGYAQEAGGLTPALRIIDVRDPVRCREIGATNTTQPIQDLAAVDGYAYLAAGPAGLRVIDVTEPQNPWEVGFLETGGTIQRVRASATTVFIGDQEGRLLAVDVSNPSQPRALAVLQMGETVGHLEIAGSFLYLTQRHAGVKVIDIDDPRSLKVVATFASTSPVDLVAVDGTFACVTGGSSLRIFDLEDPRNPTEVGSPVSISRWPHSITADGGFVYISSLDSTWCPPSCVDYDVVVMDVRDPFHPYEVKEQRFWGRGTGSLFFDHGLIYAPKYYVGFDILSGCAPPPPRLPDSRSGPP